MRSGPSQGQAKEKQEKNSYQYLPTAYYAVIRGKYLDIHSVFGLNMFLCFMSLIRLQTARCLRLPSSGGAIRIMDQLREYFIEKLRRRQHFEACNKARNVYCR